MSSPTRLEWTPAQIRVIGGTDVTEAINRLVSEAPPLSDEQRDKLRQILRPVLPARPRKSPKTNGAGLPHSPAAA